MNMLTRLLSFQAEVHCICTCPKNEKLPKMELLWLKAQREKTSSKSRFGMHGLDSKVMAAMQKTDARRQKELRVKSSSPDDEMDGSDSSFDCDDAHMTQVQSRPIVLVFLERKQSFFNSVLFLTANI